MTCSKIILILIGKKIITCNLRYKILMRLFYYHFLLLLIVQLLNDIKSLIFILGVGKTTLLQRLKTGKFQGK